MDKENQDYLNRIEETITRAGYYYVGRKTKIRKTKRGTYWIQYGRHSHGKFATLAEAIDASTWQETGLITSSRIVS